MEVYATNRAYELHGMYHYLLPDPNDMFYCPEPDMNNVQVRQMKHEDPEAATEFLQMRQKMKLILIPWNHFPEYRHFIGALPAHKAIARLPGHHGCYIPLCILRGLADENKYVFLVNPYARPDYEGFVFEQMQYECHWEMEDFPDHVPREWWMYRENIVFRCRWAPEHALGEVGQDTHISFEDLVHVQRMHPQTLQCEIYTDAMRPPPSTTCIRCKRPLRTNNDGTVRIREPGNNHYTRCFYCDVKVRFMHHIVHLPPNITAARAAKEEKKVEKLIEQMEQ